MISVWYMKRTKLLHKKYALDVEAIPVPCDLENTLGAFEGISFWNFISSVIVLRSNCVMVHKWVEILGYKWLQK